MFRVVYILTADDPNSKYIDQLLLSIYTLGLYNNLDIIKPILLTDNKTEKFVKSNESNNELLKNIEIKTIDIPYKFVTSFERSRYLKTNFRNYLSGDLLYLDSDTVICGDLNDINLFKGDLGLVYDCHCKILKKHPCYTEIVNFIKNLELNDDFNVIANQEEHIYYNSGVIFARDTERCRVFFSEWHNQWKFSVRKGIVRDQPSLFLTNSNLGLIKTLPLIYNFQLVGNVFHYISEAKVIHYFNKDLGYWCTNESLFQDFIKNLKNNSLSTSELNLVNNPRSAFTKNLRFIDEETYEILTTKIFVLIKIIKIKFPLIYISILRTLDILSKIFHNSKTK